VVYLNSPLADRAPVACANVLGTGISAINMEQAIRLSDDLLQSGNKGYVCVTGVHGIMEARHDDGLARILNRAFLCTPDGMPTVWLGRLLGHRNMRRVYGPDYMLALCKLSVARRYRHFLYGGGPGIARQLKERLESLVPNIAIVGTFTPPYRPLNTDEQQQLIAAVRECRPDIFWVGLSTPKQERFMAEYIERLDIKLMAGVGAAFDIHAGTLRDASPWVKRCGLQWLDRLIQEPHRLWRRYLLNNPRFVWNVLLQLSNLRAFEIRR
jgi:N-acetylglucosaminyldiphosphoundecaprenol N-acetyl-beta-D-mannosaminyltransferase